MCASRLNGSSAFGLRNALDGITWGNPVLFALLFDYQLTWSAISSEIVLVLP